MSEATSDIPQSTPQLHTDEGIDASSTLETILADTLPKRLGAHEWGTLTDMSGTTATYRLTDVRGLALAAGAIRYKLSATSTHLYYRGQTDDYPSGIVPSLYRKASDRPERVELDNKVRAAIDLIKSKARWDPLGQPLQSEALAQHYGLRTRWVDIVDHIQTAAWFACHSDSGKRAALSPAEWSGYIYLIAVPQARKHQVVDLRERGSNWLRPHIQQGFVIATDVDTPHVNDFVVAKFVVEATLLRSISGYSFYTKDVIFPPRGSDQGRYFWREAAKILRAELSEKDYETLVWSDGS